KASRFISKRLVDAKTEVWSRLGSALGQFETRVDTWLVCPSSIATYPNASALSVTCARCTNGSRWHKRQGMKPRGRTTLRPARCAGQNNCTDSWAMVRMKSRRLCQHFARAYIPSIKCASMIFAKKKGKLNLALSSNLSCALFGRTRIHVGSIGDRGWLSMRDADRS